MRVVFVDVAQPVHNVYDVDLHSAPAVGAKWDFGTPEGHSMHGTFRVLSVERPWECGVPDAAVVRVNVVRL